MTYLINLADKVVINSVGSDNLAAETSFHHINGINGSTWSLYSRNLRVLDAFDDVYGGVVVDSDKLPANPSEFPPILRFSISHWKKMVNPLPVFRSSPTWTINYVYLEISHTLVEHLEGKMLTLLAQPWSKWFLKSVTIAAIREAYILWCGLWEIRAFWFYDITCSWNQEAWIFHLILFMTASVASWKLHVV